MRITMLRPVTLLTFLGISAAAQDGPARQGEDHRRLRALQERVEKSLVSPARIPDRGERIGAAHRFPDGRDTTGVAVLGRELDLPTQLREHARMTAPVPFPPAMVVGQGSDPGNHTVIRLLNPHGICEIQFLAYPPSVRGGVQVAAGRFLAGQPGFAAAPLTDASVDAIRIFGRHGNLAGSIDAGRHLDPPFVIAAGDFDHGNDGAEIAVASAHAAAAEQAVCVFSGAGDLLRRIPLNLGSGAGDRLVLSTERRPEGDRLIAYIEGASAFFLVDPRTGQSLRREAGLPADCTGVYQGAATSGRFVGTRAEPMFSTVLHVDDGDKARAVNVGQRENLFWFTSDGAFAGVGESEFVRRARFLHIRTDFSSPRAANPDFSRADEEFWAGEAYREFVDSRLADYDSGLPGCWEPCFTHRWFYNPARAWATALDEETGLPAYTLCTRDNETGTYGEFGATRSFVTGTYAPDVVPIECLYIHPLRAFLRGLSRKFRRNPEHFVAVEPNHEMEINAGSPDTHGDYNPNMIRGFYRYLEGLYGGIDRINEVFGTPFTQERFDAPRDLERGGWDAYSVDNPYYLVWMRFMNYCIYRVVAGTYREALLAGFPPESVKCHQIPDHYAIASLAAFSKPAQRITPIDWNLNAGVGFGFTRYGVWYMNELNCVQGPHSSGFDAMVVGEYQSLTPDVEAAFGQLRYMRDHGVQFIHCMNWPEGHDRGYNAGLAAALGRLVEENVPRPGQTGGTGQVRSVDIGGRRVDVVSVGAGPDRTGLIKSVTPEGAWEGSVYVTPFRARVDIRALLERDRLVLRTEPVVFGPFPAVNSGELLEVAFRARASEPSHVSLRVFHHGLELPALRLASPVGPEARHVRLLLRIQLDADDVRVELGSGDPNAGTWTGQDVLVEDLVAVFHTERTLKLKRGVFAGERHRGGIMFDALP